MEIVIQNKDNSSILAKDDCFKYHRIDTRHFKSLISALKKHKKTQ